MVVEGAGPGARLPGSRPGSSSSWVAPGTRDLPLWTSPAPPLSSDGDRIERDSCSCPLRALTSSHLSGCCLWLWPHTWAILSRPGADQRYNTRQLFVGPAPKRAMGPRAEQENPAVWMSQAPLQHGGLRVQSPLPGTRELAAPALPALSELPPHPSTAHLSVPRLTLFPGFHP